MVVVVVVGMTEGWTWLIDVGCLRHSIKKRNANDKEEERKEEKGDRFVSQLDLNVCANCGDDALLIITGHAEVTPSSSSVAAATVGVAASAAG